MKNLFKTAAVFLGWSSCLAHATKCPFQESNNQQAQPSDAKQTENATPNHNALALFQDLDKIYYL